MERMKLTVTTLSPVVIPATSDTTVMTATQDYFSGTVLRGVLAAAYIRQNRLKGKAHEDKAFQQLFFGDLRFVDAYPSLKGERGIVLPLSLQKDKAGTEICDLFEPKADMAGYKSCRGIGLVRPKQEKILSLPVRKRVSLHMSREKEDERISGRSEDGDIYNYEAIEPGQEFVGEIIGEAAQLNQLRAALNLMNGKMDCYIGRSKYTQYGKCSLKIDEPETLENDLKAKGNHVYLRLDTPFLPIVQVAGGKRQPVSFGFSAKDVLQVIADELNEKMGQPGAFRIPEKTIFASSVEIDNFVGVWGMKRPRELALSAGSVFAIEKTTEWSASDLDCLWEILQTGRLSSRREEGFGQFSGWYPQHFVPASLSEETDLKQGEKRNTLLLTDEVKTGAREILRKWTLDNLSMYASQDADQLADQNNLQGMTHLFSRLETILENTSNHNDAEQLFVRELVQQELRPGSKMDKNLQQLKLGMVTLKEFLTGQAEMPYEEAGRNLSKGKELAVEIGCSVDTSFQAGALFYAYWQSFFRHAGKKSADRKEAESL